LVAQKGDLTVVQKVVLRVAMSVDKKVGWMEQTTAGLSAALSVLRWVDLLAVQ